MRRTRDAGDNQEPGELWTRRRTGDQEEFQKLRSAAETRRRIWGGKENWGQGFSPDNDDDKVQQVPAVSDVGAGMHHQAVGQNLQEGLHCEDDEEDVLHLFL